MRYDSTAPLPISTIQDLEAAILARTRESLDAAGQDCARAGHVWKELDTNAADGRFAAYALQDRTSGRLQGVMLDRISQLQNMFVDLERLAIVPRNQQSAVIS